MKAHRRISTTMKHRYKYRMHTSIMEKARSKIEDALHDIYNHEAQIQKYDAYMYDTAVGYM